MSLPRQLWFKDVGLCFVLGWDYSSDTLVVELDVGLSPGHPEHKQPNPGEIGHFVRGVLAFRNVESINGLLAQENVRPALGADGEPDYDEVHCLCSDDMRTFYLEGEFGEVWLVSESPQLELVDSGWTTRAVPDDR